jgi:hypothetical protein
MNRILFVLSLVASILPAGALAQGDRSLQAQITAADAAFFAALFDRCDVATLATLVSDDFEFVHDKWGQIAESTSEFLGNIAGMCERQKAGTDFRARRSLTPGSFDMFPLRKYGACQTGSHRFYKLGPGKPDEPTESARFAHL